jgi:hypothetical protein
MPDATVVDMTPRQPTRRYLDGTTASGSSPDRSKVAFPHRNCALATELERAPSVEVTVFGLPRDFATFLDVPTI